MTMSSIHRSAKRKVTKVCAAMCSLFLVATPFEVAAQERFASPQDAAQQLMAAARTGDTNRVLAIFGSQGRDIITSGDPVADQNARARFLAAYEASNSVVQSGEDKAELVVGEEQWPFPIPLVRSSGSWQFDAAAGRQEILARRIGGNERDAIQACLAYVDAQNEHAEMDPQGTGSAAYAQLIVSSPAKKDGLYWPTKGGEAESPLGELIAQAAREGYRPDGRGAPFRGYLFKILKGQGPAAQGGAHDYVAHGRMIGGFALVAYPAVYRNSGVKTFIVNHEGTTYEADLGPRTVDIASRMTTFNPDQSWRKIVP
jgi:hypothetical protein